MLFLEMDIVYCVIDQTPPEHKLMKQLFEDWKKTLAKADSLIITEKL